MFDAFILSLKLKGVYLFSFAGLIELNRFKAHYGNIQHDDRDTQDRDV